MRSFFIWILNQLFPVKCISCQVFGFNLCKNCQDALILDPKWVKRGRLNIFTLYDYNQPVIQKILHHWKYSHQSWLLSILLKDQLKIYFPKKYSIFYVPMNKKRKIERGRDHAEELAKEICLKVDGEMLSGLSRIKNTKQQAKLDKQERANNLKNAFIFRESCRIKNSILLVDDIVTTGETLLACLKVLEEKSDQEILAFCLARNELKKQL